MSGPKCGEIGLNARELNVASKEYWERARLERDRMNAEREIITISFWDAFGELEKERLEEERLAEERKKEQERKKEKARLEEERKKEEKRRQEERKKEEKRLAEERRQKEISDAYEREIAERRMAYEREYIERREAKEREKREEEERKRKEERQREEERRLKEERQREEERRRKEREARIAKEREIVLAFNDAVADYQVAANLAGVTPEHYEFSPQTAEAIVGKLREESEKLRQQAINEACSRRVDELIDQAVEGMGYHLLGTRETNGVHRAVSRLYRYDENTALHVIGVDGQFTMEVVAVDNVDREPTEREKERLEKSMEHFCGDYERIMERLEETGALEIKPIFHMPVSKKYASVINKTAYRSEEKEKQRMAHSADYMAETGGGERARQSAGTN